MLKKNLSGGLNVGIVGGSIAGCSAAVRFRQLGAQVTILERSPHPHHGRGAGIVLPREMLKECIALDLA